MTTKNVTNVKISPIQKIGQSKGGRGGHAHK